MNWWWRHGEVLGIHWARTCHSYILCNLFAPFWRWDLSFVPYLQHFGTWRILESRLLTSLLFCLFAFWTVRALADNIDVHYTDHQKQHHQQQQQHHEAQPWQQKQPQEQEEEEEEEEEGATDELQPRPRTTRKTRRGRKDKPKKLVKKKDNHKSYDTGLNRESCFFCFSFFCVCFLA